MSDDCMPIAALDDVRNQLADLKAEIRDKIVIDLSKHIHSVSSFAEDRWKFFANRDDEENSIIRRTLVSYLVDGKLMDGVELSKNLNLISMKDDIQPTVTENLNESPEIDTLAFITLCLESIRRLGALNETMEQLKQTNTEYIIDLIDKLVAEFSESKSNSIQSLFRDIYAKLEAAMECHWTISHYIDLFIKINQIKSVNDAIEPYKITESWNEMEQHLKKLLIDFLTVPQEESTPSTDFFKKTKHETVFRIYSNAPDKDLMKHMNLIETVNKQEKKESDARVIVPDFEYISKIYQPTIDFFIRIKKTLSTVDFRFLDEFIVSCYIPNIQENNLRMLLTHINNPDAFVLTSDGVVQSAPNVMNLIWNLCNRMRIIPIETARYGNMIEEILRLYLDQCMQKFFEQTNNHLVSQSWNVVKTPKISQWMKKSPFFRMNKDPEDFLLNEITEIAYLKIEQTDLLHPKAIELIVNLRATLVRFFLI